MKVNVFGALVPVYRKPGLIAQGISGYFDPQTRSIHIDESLTGLDFTHTLIHEVIHAAFERCGLRQTSLGPDLEEIIAENISTVLIENYSIKPRRQ